MTRRKEKRGHSRLAPLFFVEGITAGTPAYMAPEIAIGSHEVDAAADIYSLGCVGYWC